MSTEKKEKPAPRKPPSGKGPQRQTAGRLSYIIRDLKKMKAELVPDDAETLATMDITGDDFQKIKTMLNQKLSAITQGVKELNDLKKERNGVRDPEIIGLQMENTKMLQAAEGMWIKMKDAFQKNVKKGKLDAKTLEDRRKFVELFGRELMKLQQANSGIKKAAEEAATSKFIDENAKRRAERTKRREERRKKRELTRKARGADANSSDDIELDEMEKQPDKATQQFMLEVEQHTKREDELLDVISAGLAELQNVAKDINTTLDTQAQLLQEVDEKMDQTLDKYDTANARLKQLLDENTGGVEVWCPIIILIIVLLAIIGYLISIA